MDYRVTVTAYDDLSKADSNSVHVVDAATGEEVTNWQRIVLEARRDQPAKMTIVFNDEDDLFR